jgi:hypothetical protein
VSYPVLDRGLGLLVALIVAIRQRDPVLVRQIGERADLHLSDREISRSFSKLHDYSASEEDLAWLKTCGS